MNKCVGLQISRAKCPPSEPRAFHAVRMILARRELDETVAEALHAKEAVEVLEHLDAPTLEPVVEVIPVANRSAVSLAALLERIGNTRTLVTGEWGCTPSWG